MTELEKARKIINDVDKQMAELFEKRMDAARIVAEYKKQNGLKIDDFAREEQLIARNLGLIKNEDEISKYYFHSVSHSIGLDTHDVWILDSKLKKGCVITNEPGLYIEEEGIGICAGAYLGGKKTALLMQNSGLGNSINALKSLTELYKFPLLMIMSHRGTEGENICGQVPMGQSTPLILEAMDFNFFKPETPAEAYEDIKNSWELSLKEEKPVSALLEIKYW